MLKTNNNFKKRICHSSQSFRNKGSYPGCAGCALREDSHSLMQPTRNKQRRTEMRRKRAKIKLALSSELTPAEKRKALTPCLRNCGWILAALAILGLFSYLTFIPAQTFAAEETRTLADINYMQEMNKYVCDNTTEIDKQYQLIDIRDGKKYWVAKHLDNNCWMTQNLDYDIRKEDCDGAVPTMVGNLKTDSSHGNVWYSYDMEIQSWDPGDYYYILSENNFSSWPQCGTSSNMDACVDDGDWSNTAPDNAEIMHYHVGNYYSWNAATAGTGKTTESNADAVNSVCPKGWKLPTGGYDLEKDFTKLMASYGIRSYSSTDANDSVYSKVRQDPLFFIPAGYVYNTGLINAGGSGHYWSSTRGSRLTDGVQLYFDPYESGRIREGSVTSLYSGDLIRCINNPLILQSSLPDTSDTSNLSITVSPTISLDVTADAIMEDATFTKVSISNIVANVSSNYQYTVSLSTNQPNLKSDDSTIEQNIPMITTNQDITAGTSHWGIKKKLSAAGGALGSTVDADVYSPVGTGAEQIVFYKSAGPEALTNQTAANNPLTLKVGVGISPQLPRGTYSTTVTLTASTY